MRAKAFSFCLEIIETIKEQSNCLVREQHTEIWESKKAILAKKQKKKTEKFVFYSQWIVGRMIIVKIFIKRSRTLFLTKRFKRKNLIQEIKKKKIKIFIGQEKNCTKQSF